MDQNLTTLDRQRSQPPPMESEENDSNQHHDTAHGEIFCHPKYFAAEAAGAHCVVLRTKLRIAELLGRPVRFALRHERHIWMILRVGCFVRLERVERGAIPI